MGWSVPRELLWAIIFSLAVFVAALWPSQYPYSQAPQVNSQQQAKDGISGGDAAHHGPPSQENQSSQPKRQNGGEHAAETTILSIKPGEWLIGIVTWMLWFATFKLVRGAEQTAERQLRAYIFVVKARMYDVEVGKVPRVKIILKNSGQTPAYALTASVSIGFGSFPIPQGTVIAPPLAPVASKLNIGPGQIIRHQARNADQLSFSAMTAIGNGTAAIYVIGRVDYEDAFGIPRFTNFRLSYSAFSMNRGDKRPEVSAEGNECN